MRDLKVYLDSKLKELNLFSTAQKIVSSKSVVSITNVVSSFGIEIPRLVDERKVEFAVDLYLEFVKLAMLSDNFSSWGNDEWNNFITMMSLAFKEKGKAIAITSALNSISGIVLNPPGVTIENKINSGDDFITTEITFSIKKLGTPFTSRFLDLLKILIKKLYWVHHTEFIPGEGYESLIEDVTVKVDDTTEFSKNLYANTAIFCENDSSVTGSMSIHWSVDNV